MYIIMALYTCLNFINQYYHPWLTNINLEIDWLIVGCLMSSGKYFMHIQDKNKFTINTIGRSSHNRGHLGWWSGKFGLPLENEGILDRDRNFALELVTYGPLNELLQGFLTCKERGTLFTRGIGFNVPFRNLEMKCKYLSYIRKSTWVYC